MAPQGYSVLPCIDKERDNGLFAKSFGCFQSVQTFDKYEARAVRPNQDWRLQALVENARRDLVYMGPAPWCRIQWTRIDANLVATHP
jgi:hypothetical protein